jgi:L-iditol 2-dehydrogenase
LEQRCKIQFAKLVVFFESDENDFANSKDSFLNIQTTMTAKIKASVLHGVKDLRLSTVEIHPPGANELQVSIRSTGICGSDLHYYSHFRLGDILVREPMILGHESAGIVIAVGSELQNEWRAGDKVALEVGIPCGKDTCELCKGGNGERYNVCQSMRFRSSAKSYPHLQGTLQERVNHPGVFCHRLPEGMDSSLSGGALAEPLAVAVHANKRAGLEVDKTILVLGAGPVGLLVSAIAKISGAKEVVIADIDGARLEFATGRGFADKAYLIERPSQGPKDVKEALDIAQAIRSKMGLKDLPMSYDAVFECTGVEACLQAAIYACLSTIHLNSTDFYTVHEASRKDHAHWNGHSHPDDSHLYGCSSGSGPHRRISLHE